MYLPCGLGLVWMSHWRHRATEGAEFWISFKQPAFLSKNGFTYISFIPAPLGCFQESCWPKWLFNDLAVVCFYTQYVICDGFSDRSHIQLPRRRKVNYTNFSRETPMMERKVWGQKLIATDLWTLPSLSWKICIKLHSLVCNYHKNIKTPAIN